jgi:hypothetical protein
VKWEQVASVIIPAVIGGSAALWGRRIESRRSAADVVAVEVGAARSVVEMLRAELDRERAVRVESEQLLRAEIDRLRTEVHSLRVELARFQKMKGP